MKKTLCLLLIFVGLCTTSCKITRATAEYKDPTTYLGNATVADLDVATERISFTFQPSRQVRRGGNINVINAAIREALRVNGGGDVLVDLEYITLEKPSFFLSSIREITVSGYPARYKNFHSLDDSIWQTVQLNSNGTRTPTLEVKINKLSH